MHIASLNTVLLSDPKTKYYMPYLSTTVAHVFSVDYWRNIEMCVTGRLRSLKIVPFESFGMFLSAAYVVMRCLSTVCVFVCPSVTFVDNVKTNKHIFKFFSPSGSQAIPVFPYQTSWHYSDGDSSNRGRRMQGRMKKMTIFDQYLALSPK